MTRPHRYIEGRGRNQILHLLPQLTPFKRHQSPHNCLNLPRPHPFVHPCSCPLLLGSESSLHCPSPLHAHCQGCLQCCQPRLSPPFPKPTRGSGCGTLAQPAACQGCLPSVSSGTVDTCHPFGARFHSPGPAGSFPSVKPLPTCLPTQLCPSTNPVAIPPFRVPSKEPDATGGRGPPRLLRDVLSIYLFDLQNVFYTLGSSSAKYSV